MTEAIFKAALFLEQVRRDIDHLCDAVSDGLKAHGVQAKYSDDWSHEDDVSDYRALFEFSLKGISPKKRSEAQLILYFDLARPGPTTEWSASQKSVLVVAYHPRFDVGWALEELAFKPDGSFESHDSRRLNHALPDAGHRFVARANGSSADSWWKREWMFAVELEQLTGPEAVEKNIVRPIVRLLKEDAPPSIALDGCDAVAWPSA